MSYSHYISSVIGALKDQLAKEVTSDRGKNILNTSINTLAIVAASLERTKSGVPGSAPIDGLSNDLANKINRAAPSKTNQLILPVPSMPDDLPASTVWGNQITILADWIGSLAQEEFSNNTSTIDRLLEWEQAIRSDLIARADALIATNPQAVANQQDVTDIQPARLEAYLQQRLKTPKLVIDKFSLVLGGRSRQTALFEISGTDLIPSKLVCQRETPGVKRPPGYLKGQFDMLKAVAGGGVKAPPPVLFETDDAVLGASFLITEQIQGVPPAHGDDYFAPPPKLPQVALSLARQMGQLHKLSAKQFESILPRSFSSDQSSNWTEDLQHLKTSWFNHAIGHSITVTTVFRWLEQHVAEISDKVVVVHKDMLFHNVLAKNNEITAILDWEIAALGHPAEDLGYVKPVMEQVVDWNEFLAVYFENGGAEVSETEVDWFTLWSLFSLLVMSQERRELLVNGVSDNIVLAEIAGNWMTRVQERVAVIMRSIIKRI